MKAVEFCYWLQGLFELTNPASLTQEQVAVIIKHLEMVDIHDKTDGRSRQFCTTLKNTFSLFGAVGLSQAQMHSIKKMLNEVFLHEIDPNYPVNEIDALNQAHHGSKWDDYPPTLRC